MPRKIVTVNGPITGDKLGITLMHEHIFINMLMRYQEPSQSKDRQLAKEPVKIENLHWIKMNPFYSKDNLLLTDHKDAVYEVNLAKIEGVSTIVDVTNWDLGRNPKALKKVSDLTGMNIIMGTGYYTNSPQVVENKENVDELKEKIVSDIKKGEGSTGIQPGIIGEIGVQSFEGKINIKKREEMALRAAAQAQKETGLALSIHSHFKDMDGHKIVVDMVEGEGVDLSKVIICHQDSMTLGRPGGIDIQMELADRGCYIEYDTWGLPSISVGGMDLPADYERVKGVQKMIEAGYGNKLLFSQDVCMKLRLRKYGGGGYSHLLENIVPKLINLGIARDLVKSILIENPLRVLSI